MTARISGTSRLSALEIAPGLEGAVECPSIDRCISSKIAAGCLRVDLKAEMDAVAGCLLYDGTPAP
jgi:hypothetical protein